jgi:lipopolysaccharide assembly protein A
MRACRPSIHRTPCVRNQDNAPLCGRVLLLPFHPMRALVWLLRAFVFFALFAFALNNQQDTVVHWFFGVEWHTRLVMVVLAAFALGCALGVLAMVPAWWRHKRVAQRRDAAVADDAPLPPTRAKSVAEPALPSQFGAEAAYPPPHENLR